LLITVSYQFLAQFVLLHAVAPTVHFIDTTRLSRASDRASEAHLSMM